MKNPLPRHTKTRQPNYALCFLFTFVTSLIATMQLHWQRLQLLSNLSATESKHLDVTTHYMDEAEYCNRVSIMVDGQIKALDTPQRLEQQFGMRSMYDVFLQPARKTTRGDSRTELTRKSNLYYSLSNETVYHIRQERVSLHPA